MKRVNKIIFSTISDFRLAEKSKGWEIFFPREESYFRAYGNYRNHNLKNKKKYIVKAAN